MGDRATDLASWKAAARDGKAPERAALLKQYVPDQIKADGEGAARTYTFTISTGAVDRERDTISVEGWQLDNYRKNPVVLWAHDYRQPPVGAAESVLARSGLLIARMRFAPPDAYPFAETVRALVDGGYLRATSVGFRPLTWVYNEERGGYDFQTQELMEFSIVPVPANAEALIEAREAGVDLTPLKSWAEKILDGIEPGLWLPKDTAARVLKIAGGAPASVSVAGASAGAAGVTHAAETPGALPGPADPSTKAGRTLSAKSEALITSARDSLNDCLAQVASDNADDGGKNLTGEPRLIVRAVPPTEPRKFLVNPEAVRALVGKAVQDEIARRRGRLD